MDAKLQKLALALSLSALTACGGGSSSSDSPSNTVEEETGSNSYSDALSSAEIAVSDTKSGGAGFQHNETQACQDRDYVVAGKYDTRVAFNADDTGSKDELKHYAKIAAFALDDKISEMP